jgi:hypothetical protein
VGDTPAYAKGYGEAGIAEFKAKRIPERWATRNEGKGVLLGQFNFAMVQTLKRDL